jgi:hypothetical protein
MTPTWCYCRNCGTRLNGPVEWYRWPRWCNDCLIALAKGILSGIGASGAGWMLSHLLAR